LRHAHSNAPDTGLGRILLVDDDAAILKLYDRVLRSAGWSVEAVLDSSQAAQLVAKERFDVVITDIRMPKLSGVDLLHAIRRQGADVPVILTTAEPDVETATKAVEYGAFRYLVKAEGVALLVDIVARAARLHRLSSCTAGTPESSGTRRCPPNEVAMAALEERLDRALERVYMVYQPVVSCGNRRVFGYEALVRCADPALANPAELFDVAGRIGRVPDLGRVIRAEVAAAARNAPQDAFLLVNVHPEELSDPDLVSPDAPLTALSSRVVLEITERATLEHVAGLSGRLSKLRQLGFRIAVDDLGAGYAGLSCLLQIEPEIVKLDMSLVRGVDAAPRKSVVVRSMIELAARELGMSVICEGVETPEERDALALLGCDLMQGYLFARPAREFLAPQEAAFPRPLPRRAADTSRD
jgi:EAL domain-containing protein (putative c-di-GMP-specific phosphodiesterase class I)/CheY-like chemotaxis protein